MVDVVSLVQRKPKSRPEMVEALHDVIRECYDSKLDYLEIIYQEGGVEKHKMILGGTYSIQDRTV